LLMDIRRESGFAWIALECPGNRLIGKGAGRARGYLNPGSDEPSRPV
jgi:hypothetical protein